jgi:hypothetical protein
MVELPPAPKTGKSPSLPSYLRSATQSADTFLPQDDLRLANLDIETLRTTGATPDLLRKLVKASPDLSAAAFAAVRLGITGSYTALSRNLDGTLNREGTLLVQQLCRRFDLLGPTDGGYNAYPSIRSSSESMGRELMLLGACSLEVVPNKARLPEALLPIAVDTIKFKYQKGRKVPFQVVGGVEIPLDYPTFFYVSLDQSLRTAYPDSPVESSIQPMVAMQAFVSDLRRVFRRAIHPRIKAMINEEKWRKSVPAEVMADPAQLKEYMDNTSAEVQALIDSLNPEDALILFDVLDISYLTGGSTSLSEEYKTLAGIYNSKLASGSKTMPAILGHAEMGSQNIASTQSMLYLKTVEGAVLYKLNEIYSRALTLCIRMYGIDAVVEFEYERPNLRPDAELESFKSVRQSRYLEQLSIGQIDDDEASLKLTGTLPPVGAKKLSGTFFKAQAPQDTGNSTSNTSALDQDLTGEAPRGVKSK